jgi:hypothetical protein
MRDVSTFRLYLLRATYLLLVVGLGSTIWPGLLDPPRDLEHMRGVVRSLLGAVALLALVGLRHPLRMLPLLLFELAWKSIWVLAIGLPLWSTGRLDPGTRETWNACLMGLVIFPLAIPWGYVIDRYVRRRGDRWGRATPPLVAPASAVSGRGQTA